jgi:hypothetical protein
LRSDYANRELRYALDRLRHVHVSVLPIGPRESLCKGGVVLKELDEGTYKTKPAEAN